RQRYWLRDAPVGSGLRGARGRGAPPAPWLTDHVVGGRVLVPATALLELVRGAATTAGDDRPRRITDFVVHQPLVLDDAPAEAWRTVVVRDEDGADVVVWTVPGDNGSSRCIATARAEAVATDPWVLEPGVDETDEWREGAWRDEGDRRYQAFA